MPAPRKRRWGIRDLMIAVAVAGGLFALLRNRRPLVIPLFLPCSLWVVGVPFLLAWAFTHFRRTAAMAMIGCLALSITYIILCDIHITKTPTFFLVAITLFFSAPPCLGFAIAYEFGARRLDPNPRPGPKLAAISMLLVILLPIILFPGNVPLRIAFFVSRPALDRLADRVASGENVSFPVWAGVFRIVEARTTTNKNTVGLIVVASPGSSSGLIRGNEPYTHKSGHDYRREPPIINLAIDMPLNHRWCAQCQD